MQRSPALVCASQRQQGVHQLSHPVHLEQRLLERLHHVWRCRRMRERALDSGPQHRERRLELVARVGREATQRAERFLEARQHRVQGYRQARQLVIGRRLGQAPVQTAAVADRLDLVHDEVDRLQSAPHQQVSDHERHDEDERAGPQHGSEQARRADDEARGRRRRDHGRHVRARLRDRPDEVAHLSNGRCEIHQPESAGNRVLGHVDQGPRRTERQGPSFGRQMEQRAFRAHHDHVARNSLEQRRDVRREHRPAQRIRHDDPYARTERLTQNSRDQIRLHPDPAVELGECL